MADTADTEFCTNCHRDIAAGNFIMHEMHCRRNIVLCTACDEPVARSELQAHQEEAHATDACSLCGVAVEKCRLADHAAMCPKRSVSCSYCELELPRDDLRTHREYCGSRTEACSLCSAYIMKRDEERHLASGCLYPPPKNTNTHGANIAHDFEADAALPLDFRNSFAMNELSRIVQGDMMTGPPPYQLLHNLTGHPPNPRREQGARQTSSWERGSKNCNLLDVANTRNPQPSDGVSGTANLDPDDLNNSAAIDLDHDLAMRLANDLSDEEQWQAINGFDAAEPISEKSEDVCLPCEFCGDPFPADALILHQGVCVTSSHDITSARGIQYFPRDNNISNDIPAGAIPSDILYPSKIPVSLLSEGTPTTALSERILGSVTSGEIYTDSTFDEINGDTLPMETIPNNRSDRYTTVPANQPNIVDNLGYHASYDRVSAAASAGAAGSGNHDDEEEELVWLPCEFCEEMFPRDCLVQHQSVCATPPFRETPPPCANSPVGTGPMAESTNHAHTSRNTYSALNQSRMARRQADPDPAVNAVWGGDGTYASRRNDIPRDVPPGDHRSTRPSPSNSTLAKNHTPANKSENGRGKGYSSRPRNFTQNLTRNSSFETVGRNSLSPGNPVPRNRPSPTTTMSNYGNNIPKHINPGTNASASPSDRPSPTATTSNYANNRTKHSNTRINTIASPSDNIPRTALAGAVKNSNSQVSVKNNNQAPRLQTPDERSTHTANRVAETLDHLVANPTSPPATAMTSRLAPIFTSNEFADTSAVTDTQAASLDPRLGSIFTTNEFGGPDLGTETGPRLGPIFTSNELGESDLEAQTAPRLGPIFTPNEFRESDFGTETHVKQINGLDNVQGARGRENAVGGRTYNPDFPLSAQPKNKNRPRNATGAANTWNASNVASTRNAPRGGPAGNAPGGVRNTPSGSRNAPRGASSRNATGGAGQQNAHRNAGSQTRPAERNAASQTPKSQRRDRRKPQNDERE